MKGNEISRELMYFLAKMKRTRYVVGEFVLRLGSLMC